MFKVLQFFALFVMCMVASNAMAAGYTCEELIEYTSCDPGYYITYGGEYNATLQAGNDCTICPVGHACSGGLADKVACASGEFTGGEGATTCTTCPTVDSQFAQYVARYESDASLGTGVKACSVVLKDIPVSGGNGVLSEIPCRVTGDAATTYDSCNQTNVDALHCNGGYYGGDAVFERSGCTFGADGVEVCETKVAGDLSFGAIASMIDSLKADTYCTAVGAGYYSANESLAIMKCPDGETTVGFGAGADEAGDCGVIMHVGDANLYLRSEKPETTPALNVLRNGKQYYANMSVTDVSLSYASPKKLRVLANGISYWVHDDSVNATPVASQVDVVDTNPGGDVSGESDNIVESE